MYERSKEHITAWNEGDDECPLQRHSNIYHNGNRFDVLLRIVAKCYGKPSRKLITEAVKIDGITDGQAMNNKNEWTYTNLKKVNLNK